MGFKPEYTYDAEEKIWCGLPYREYYAPDLSIGEIIFQEMKRHPKLTAQISATENTVLTREELHLNSMRVASFMRRLGMVQSDIVGIMARNTTHIFAVVYGCFFNGIAFHSLNISYEESTTEKLFNITKPRLIFCDGEEYEKVKSATADLNVMIVTMRNHHKDSISIEEVLATPVQDDFTPSRLDHGIDQTLAILCSSGTTGTPKAVTITNSRKILNTSTQLTVDDVQYTHSTLDWISGLLTAVSTGVYSTTRIIADNPFDPVRLLRVIEQYKVTWLVQAPSHLAMMANCKEFEQANLHSIRAYLYGGGRCSVEAQHRVRSSLRSDCMHMAYGLTEAGTMVSMNWNFDEKPNSVGRIAEGFMLKILNEERESLGPNEVGEICVNNGQYWAGYFGNPEESQKMRDSKLWFHTGDLGYMDDDGFLFIVERKKDMLKYQNIMYYPSDVEEIISKMPEVSEVCVFGIWNQFNGDEAAAAVVKKVGSQIEAQDIVDYVESHTDAKYKQLHGGVIIVDDLIRSANGKTNRQATKAHFLDIKDRK
ncbi:4-coumarate--CoA ligase 1-like [Drosophila innubila]|uniref:4-coumarate--CoA ligase 1-like n=1 Tax=Drosophila innubila TaxID=198719 RepID=UPI00148BD437|nr:4-coumarate--CoA ligase 1-like [Drosophila innubila]